MKKKLTTVLLLLQLAGRAQVADRYDVIIDEIMADPSPQIGLPASEFIELKNVSRQAFNLNGWQIGDSTGTAVIRINFVLQPDSFLIICASNAAASFSSLGAVIGVSNFPSLGNEGDQLFVRSKDGKIIHALNYSSSSYKNPVKSQGGWSLEMIDTRNPCGAENNWIASSDYKGGTPGKKNSADASNPDRQPPALLHAFVTDSLHVILEFDEPLDSVKAAVTAGYLISEGIGSPLSALAMPPVFDKVQLQVASPVIANKIYNVTVKEVSDCSGNTIGAYNKTKLGRAVAADTGSLVINELLFNPPPGVEDYIELYNRSSSIIDLRECYIANRSSGNIGSLRQISSGSRLLFPGEYIVLTSDIAAVQRQYLAKDPLAFILVNTLPSYPDDKGDVVILNAQGTIIDELRYDEHWQFAILNTHEAVALERIDYDKPTQDPANWHSAASTAGYGTPGYQNSQYTAAGVLQGEITVSPEIFSPDNDGFDDFLSVSYQFPASGYVCNITVFDASGRPVRFVCRNAVCGLQGNFRWDGLDDKQGKLPIGIYIVFCEVYNLQGKTMRSKQAVTLARRL